MDLEEGELLVKTARKVVESLLENEKFEVDEKFKERFSEPRGVFTTIKKYPNHELRGCIGFPYPELPLWKALVESAKAAAFEDPRFEPLKKEEIDKVIFEVTVLTPPRKIKYKDPFELIEKIKIGKHGLIVKYGPFSGLLLPQVPVEEKWDVPEFLGYACLKAGLPMDAWLKIPLEVFVFEGEIFEEVKPRGQVIKRKI